MLRPCEIKPTCRPSMTPRELREAIQIAIKWRELGMFLSGGTPTPKPDTFPVPFKLWLARKSVELGVHTRTVRHYVYTGKLKPKLRRVNPRLFIVEADSNT